jgi:hypothetical protein
MIFADHTSEIEVILYGENAKDAYMKIDEGNDIICSKWILHEQDCKEGSTNHDFILKNVQFTKILKRKIDPVSFSTFNYIVLLLL